MSCFEADGVEVVALFARDQVLDARADIDDHIDRMVAALHIPVDECAPEVAVTRRLDAIAARHRSYADLLRRAVCTDAHRGARLSALADASKLLATAERLAGVPLTGSIARVRASIASFPEHRHPWHSDVATPDETGCGRVRIAAWIPLCDVGGSGGLEILRGRRSGPIPHLRSNGLHIEDASIPSPDIIAPACPAGSVIFLDRFTPHRTRPVVGDARFALVVWFNTAAAQQSI